MGKPDEMRQEPEIELHRLTPKNAAEFQRFVLSNHDDYVKEFESMRGESYTLGDAKWHFEQVDREGNSEWGVYENKKFIGIISLYPSKTLLDTLELHYFADKSVRGHGIIPAAVTKLIQDLPEQFKVVYAAPRAANESSVRMLQKLGFVFWQKTNDGHAVYLYMPHEKRQPVKAHET